MVSGVDVDCERSNLLCVDRLEPKREGDCRMYGCSANVGRRNRGKGVSCSVAVEGEGEGEWRR